MGFNTFPCNPYPISTEELNKGNNDDLNTRVTALEGEVSDLNSTKANQITIAPFFSAEASYSVGDLVYYNGLTYRCTNDHEGEWDADDFAATTISGELDTLKSGLNNLGTVVPLVHEEMPVASSWTPYQDITIDVNEYRYFGLMLSLASTPNTGTPLCIFSRSEFLASNANAPLAVLFSTTDSGNSYNVFVAYNEEAPTPLFYYRGSNVTDTLYLTIVGIK